jgi:hypothetical protein
MSVLTIKLASLTGFNDEQSMFLYSAHPELNFVAIAVSTMILATLGAVMDVAMSIASTINEIFTIDNTKTVKELFTSGMNVGKDIIGTMANTLILVYLGASLPLLLLASNVDLQKFINLNQVVSLCNSIRTYVSTHNCKFSKSKRNYKRKDGNRDAFEPIVDAVRNNECDTSKNGNNQYCSIGIVNLSKMIHNRNYGLCNN